MKKGSFILILIFCAFICIMIGILIGRQTASNIYSVGNTNPPYVESEMTTTATASDFGKININDATIDELATLPGIGETIAQRIIDFRERYGQFTNIDELSQVQGIGEKRLDAIRDYITVGG